jgi:hypothetical protein
MTWPQSGRSKYRNKPTVFDGITYHSKKEADFAATLKIQMHAQGKDKVESWERQIRIPLFVNDRKICDYIVDFRVRYADGRRELVEVKGMWTDVAKLKRKLFEAIWRPGHPDVEYRVV